MKINSALLAAGAFIDRFYILHPLQSMETQKKVVKLVVSLLNFKENSYKSWYETAICLVDHYSSIILTARLTKELE